MDLHDGRIIVRVRDDVSEPPLIAIITHLDDETGRPDLLHGVSNKPHVADQMTLVLVLFVFALEHFVE